jgi:hypothetical protein
MTIFRKALSVLFLLAATLTPGGTFSAPCHDAEESPCHAAGRLNAGAGGWRAVAPSGGGRSVRHGGAVIPAVSGVPAAASSAFALPIVFAAGIALGPRSPILRI